MDAEAFKFIDSILDRRIIVAFDLFGTLLSTDSISTKLAEYYGDKANSISTAWRKYQLEYTWRLNSMGSFEPFDTVTKKSLLHALSESKITHNPEEIAQIIASYGHLSPFSDVKPALETLTSIKRLHPIIFTNGTTEMARSALETYVDLKTYFTAVAKKDIYLAADEIEKYKPHPMIYQYLAAKVGKSIAVGQAHGGIDEVVLVSANPFDIVGAQAVGITGVWVDRSGGGWQDSLVEEGPKFTVAGLEELVGVLEGILEGKGKVWAEADKGNKSSSHDEF
ncbi:hypothetical protein TWF694_010870 [Orbilia ellipsospora]|uniref:Haloacid dehalogenase n=1 Tax=Orbilia ellipsospora TaxID=2528407 RepID=A0AAV9X7A7_9PEZI